MARTLLRDSTIYGLGSILMQSIGFLLIPLYTRYLEVSEYGMLSLLNATLQMVSFVSVLGISSAAMRLYFEPDADEAYQRRLYGNATVMLLVFPALTLVVMGPLLWVLTTRFLTSVPFFPLVFIVTVIGLFTPIVKLMTGLLRVRRLPRAFVAFNLAFFLVETITIIIAVAWLGLGLKGQIYSQLIANALFAAIALVVLLRASRPTFSAALTLRMLAFGVPLVPFFIFNWLNNAAGRFFLERFADLSQVGIFALAAQFAGVMHLFATAMDNAMVPHFLARASQPGARRELGVLVSRYLVVFGLLGLAVVAGAAPVILLVTAPQYHDATRYIAPLTLAAWLFVANKPVVWSLNHSKRTGLLSSIVGSSTAVLLVLLVVFLGWLKAGINGVAYAMIGANLFSLIIGYVIAQRHFALELPWSQLAGIIVSLLAGGALMAYLAPEEFRPGSLAVQAALFIGLAALTSRLAGIKNPLALFRLKK